MQDVGERIALGFVEAERQRRANVPDTEVVETDGLFQAVRRPFGHASDCAISRRRTTAPAQTVCRLGRKVTSPASDSDLIGVADRPVG